MARDNFGGKVLSLVFALSLILLLFLAVGQSLQYDLPKVVLFGTEDERMLTSFPAFFQKGDYVCYPTIGKHIFYQTIGGKKEICQRGEIIPVKKELQTYIWYR